MKTANSIISFGGISSDAAQRAQENFANPSIQIFSLCCTPIELLSLDGQDSVVSHASGFFVRYGGQPYLVTCWHVLSGRNPFTGELMSQAGFIPRRIRFWTNQVVVGDDESNYKSTEISLTMSEGVGDAPTVDGLLMDVAAIKLVDSFPSFVRIAAKKTDGVSNSTTLFLNEITQKSTSSRASDDCSVLGYPIGNYEGIRLPIWKSGKIASDTNVGLGDRPMFLLDCATTSGMSGAPVLRVERFPHLSPNGIIGLEVSFDFVGIYAGRLQNSLLEATQLGYVYYSSLLERAVKASALT